MAKPSTGKTGSSQGGELLGQLVEDVFCDAVAGSAGVWRKRLGEWTTAELLHITDESAG